MIRFSPVKSARSILAFKYPQSVQNMYLEGTNVSTKIKEAFYFILFYFIEIQGLKINSRIHSNNEIIQESFKTSLVKLVELPVFTVTPSKNNVVTIQ